MPRKPLGLNDWLAKAKSIHGDDYDYSQLGFVDWKSPIKIICNNCNTEFVHSSAREHIRQPPRALGCPIKCKDQSIQRIKDHPLLSLELDKSRAEKVRVGKQKWWVSPEWLPARTNLKLDWICIDCNHSWNADRSGRQGCPACGGKEVCNHDGWNSVSSIFPELARIWSNKNNISPDLVVYGSGKKYYFNCTEDEPCDRVHYYRLDNKSRRMQCMFCRKEEPKWITVWNQHPDLINLLSDKNDICDVPAKSKEIFSWKCQSCGLIEERSIVNQVKRKRRELCGDCNRNMGAKISAQKNRLQFSDFVERANHVHGSSYLYSEDGFSGSSSYIEMTHIKCGTTETRLANSHLQGAGCTKCADYGFDRQSQADYYVHEVIEKSTGGLLFYKAGIAADWRQRAQVLRRHLPSKYQLRYLRHVTFSRGQDAWNFEQQMLDIESIRVKPKNFQGGHELFVVDPLEKAKMENLLSDHELIILSANFQSNSSNL